MGINAMGIIPRVNASALHSKNVPRIYANIVANARQIILPDVSWPLRSLCAISATYSCAIGSRIPKKNPVRPRAIMNMGRLNGYEIMIQVANIGKWSATRSHLRLHRFPIRAATRPPSNCARLTILTVMYDRCRSEDTVRMWNKRCEERRTLCHASVI